MRIDAFEESDKSIEVFLLSQFLFVARYPVYRDGSINRHARLVQGDFRDGLVIASKFQGHEPPITVTDKQGCSGFVLESTDIFTLFGYAIIIALRSALPASAPLDRMNGKMLGKLACEGCVAAGQRERAGHHNHRWPAAHAQITNRGPVRRAHSTGGASGRVCVMLNHYHGSFCVGNIV